MNLGENIYRLRIQRNMSQTDLADALEVSRQSVSKWETGTAVPELDKLVKMSTLFSVSLDELINKTIPDKSPQQPPVTPELSSDFPLRTPGYMASLILLACALLTFLLAGLTGFIPLGIPLVVCSILCLVLKRRRGIWCGWILLVWFPLWLPNPTATFVPFWSLFSSLVRPRNFSASLYQLIITSIANATTVMLAVFTLRSYLDSAIRFVSTHKTNLLLGWLLTVIPSIAVSILEMVITYQLARSILSPPILSIGVYLLTLIHLGAVLTMLILTVARLRRALVRKSVASSK